MEDERELDRQQMRLAERELLEAANIIRAMRGYDPLSELPQPPFCSFCTRAKAEVGALVEGLNGAYICRECAEAARHLLLRG